MEDLHRYLGNLRNFAQERQSEVEPPNSISYEDHQQLTQFLLLELDEFLLENMESLLAGLDECGCGSRERRISLSKFKSDMLRGRRHCSCEGGRYICEGSCLCLFG